MLIGFVIVIVAIAVWCLVMYWLIKLLYNRLKPKMDSATELKGKIELLEKRVELLEQKLDDK